MPICSLVPAAEESYDDFGNLDSRGVTNVKAKLVLAICGLRFLLAAQTPHFEVDPSWPKPLPEGWITGQLGGVCTDSHDHIVVVNRRDITVEEAETSQQAPPIIMFDQAGRGHPEIQSRGKAAEADRDAWVFRFVGRDQQREI